MGDRSRKGENNIGRRNEKEGKEDGEKREGEAMMRMEAMRGLGREEWKREERMKKMDERKM